MRSVVQQETLSRIRTGPLKSAYFSRGSQKNQMLEVLARIATEGISSVAAHVRGFAEFSGHLEVGNPSSESEAREASKGHLQDQPDPASRWPR